MRSRANPVPVSLQLTAKKSLFKPRVRTTQKSGVTNLTMPPRTQMSKSFKFWNRQWLHFHGWNDPDSTNFSSRVRIQTLPWLYSLRLDLLVRSKICFWLGIIPWCRWPIPTSPLPYLYTRDFECFYFYFSLASESAATLNKRGISLSDRGDYCEIFWLDTVDTVRTLVVIIRELLTM